MFTHSAEFYRAISLGIEAENLKATVYVRHGASLGTARENNLREVLEDSTPAPFKLATGLLHDTFHDGPRCSSQCDVLVYDPTVDPPKYAFRDFVVLDPRTARLVVEVKSTLGEKKFGHILEVATSVRQFRIPTMAFAYRSVTFESFVGYFASAFRDACARDDAPQLPYCAAVHKNNYLAIRPHHTQPTDRPYVMLVDFGRRSRETTGYAAALFLQFYDMLLRGKTKLYSGALYQWFNGLTSLPAEQRVYIGADGQPHRGEIAQLTV
jgi:hypothetical protein